MAEAILIRRALPSDAPVLARHRVEMFKDMGDLPEDQYEPLRAAAERDLRAWLETGEYAGWVAAAADRPAAIVAGGGVQLRRLLPRPNPDSSQIREGLEAIVLNVYTEQRWRRRGVARRLMEEIIAWVRAEGIGRLVLHASRDGRALYESMGFEQTNEMRFMGELG